MSMKEEPSIQTLVCRAMGGSSEDWHRIVDRFAPMIWSLARSCGLNSSDAEDVSQTVFTKLVAHIQTIKNPQALPQWISVTTRRESWRVKAISRRTRQGSEFILESEPAREEELASLEHRKQEVREALQGLNSQCKELLTTLFGSRDTSYGHVAEQLGLSLNSVGPTRRRCLQALLERLDASLGDF